MPMSMLGLGIVLVSAMTESTAPRARSRPPEAHPRATVTPQSAEEVAAAVQDAGERHLKVRMTGTELVTSLRS
jgi:FAD/FMN-containing dehydrogenase